MDGARAGGLPEGNSVAVAEFLRQAPARLALRLIADERNSEPRRITDARVRKTRDALAGLVRRPNCGGSRAGRGVHLYGRGEACYVADLTQVERRRAIERLDTERIACVLVAKSVDPPAELTEVLRDGGVPVLRTELAAGPARRVAGEYLRQRLAPREVRHGVLLDLYGLGVLVEGRSGIGKSECALDLVARGARLVADDAVEVRRAPGGELWGAAPEMLRGLIEIRGLGIIDVQEVYGASALGDEVRLRLVVRLAAWDANLDAGNIDRLGLDDRTIDVLGVRVPQILLPVSPGRNLSTLVDAAVRVHSLRLRGRDAARRFVEEHTRRLETDVTPETEVTR